MSNSPHQQHGSLVESSASPKRLDFSKIPTNTNYSPDRFNSGMGGAGGNNTVAHHRSPMLTTSSSAEDILNAMAASAPTARGSPASPHVPPHTARMQREETDTVDDTFLPPLQREETAMNFLPEVSTAANAGSSAFGQSPATTGGAKHSPTPSLGILGFSLGLGGGSNSGASAVAEVKKVDALQEDAPPASFESSSSFSAPPPAAMHTARGPHSSPSAGALARTGSVAKGGASSSSPQLSAAQPPPSSPGASASPLPQPQSLSDIANIVDVLESSPQGIVTKTHTTTNAIAADEADLMGTPARKKRFLTSVVASLSPKLKDSTTASTSSTTSSGAAATSPAIAPKAAVGGSPALSPAPPLRLSNGAGGTPKQQVTTNSTTAHQQASPPRSPKPLSRGLLTTDIPMSALATPAPEVMGGAPTPSDLSLEPSVALLGGRSGREPTDVWFGDSHHESSSKSSGGTVSRTPSGNPKWNSSLSINTAAAVGGGISGANGTDGDLIADEGAPSPPPQTATLQSTAANLLRVRMSPQQRAFGGGLPRLSPAGSPSAAALARKKLELEESSTSTAAAPDGASQESSAANVSAAVGGAGEESASTPQRLSPVPHSRGLLSALIEPLEPTQFAAAITGMNLSTAAIEQHQQKLREEEEARQRAAEEEELEMLKAAEAKQQIEAEEAERKRLAELKKVQKKQLVLNLIATGGGEDTLLQTPRTPVGATSANTDEFPSVGAHQQTDGKSNTAEKKEGGEDEDDKAHEVRAAPAREGSDNGIPRTHIAETEDIFLAAVAAAAGAEPVAKDGWDTAPASVPIPADGTKVEHGAEVTTAPKTAPAAVPSAGQHPPPDVVSEATSAPVPSSKASQQQQQAEAAIAPTPNPVAAAPPPQPPSAATSSSTTAAANTPPTAAPASSSSSFTLPGLKDYICGTLSGIGKVVAGYPFDTLKGRVQGGNYGGSVRRALIDTLTKEGPMAFYQGVTYPALNVCLVGGVLFYVNGAIRHYQQPDGIEPLTYKQMLVAGTGGGAAVGLVITPMEVLKVRLQLLNKAAAAEAAAAAEREMLAARRRAARKAAKAAAATTAIPTTATTATVTAATFLTGKSTTAPINMVDARTIYSSLRKVDFFAGFTPTMIRECGTFGLFFPINEYLKRKIALRRDGIDLELIERRRADQRRAKLYGLTEGKGGHKDIIVPQPCFTTRVMAAGLAGICCWLPVYPADQIKTRMQLRPAFTYKSWLHCGAEIVKQEGIKVGLFKGLGPCLIRAFPAYAAQYLLFEKLQSLWTEGPKRKNKNKYSD